MNYVNGNKGFFFIPNLLFNKGAERKAAQKTASIRKTKKSYVVQSHWSANGVFFVFVFF